MPSSVSSSPLLPLAGRPLPAPVAGAERADGERPPRAANAASVDESAPIRPSVPERAELSTTVQQLNDLAAHLRRELRFDIDEVSGRTVINVVDGDTDEVIRQIPPEEMIALAEHFEDLQGLLLRQRA